MKKNNNKTKEQAKPNWKERDKIHWQQKAQECPGLTWYGICGASKLKCEFEKCVFRHWNCHP